MNTRILFSTTLLASLLLVAATLPAQDIKGVDVKSLSSEQINKAKQALQSSGMSSEQAISEARKRGASETQIQDMKNRLGMTDGLKTAEAANAAKEAEAKAIEDAKNPTDETKKEEVPVVAGTRTVGAADFGSYLFRGKNLTFEPALNIQTPKNYEINIGDEVLLNIWGNSVADYQLIIDRNGQIQIPQIGPVYLAGKTFDQAAAIIKNRLISIYAGMGGARPNTFAQVNMGRLRSIRVNMVGEVSTPGTYTLPATASVFNALYLSGGPNGIGSFRNIRIYRDNVLYRTIDIYDFLINGDQKDNIVLKNDDVIFIPVAEKKVTVKGQFKRTAIFELKDKETMKNLLVYAAGFTNDAYLPNVKIYRKTQEGTTIMDIPHASLNTTTLVDGDVVISEKTMETLKNRVTIAGAVFRPGEYEWKPYLMLSELVLKADSIMPDAMVEMGQITRLNPDLSLSQITFNVREVMNGKGDLTLQQEDAVIIKSHFDLKDVSNITVDGHVRAPGTFEFKENMSILDAIYQAGGFTEDADSTYIQVSRRLNYQNAASLSEKLVDIFTITMPRDLNANDRSSAFKLSPYDHISIRRAPGYSEQGTVSVNGEVLYSGTYTIQTKSDRISDLVKWSGGLRPNAYPEAATFVKADVGMVGFNLKKILDRPRSRFDLMLNPGDALTIPLRPQTVNVTGQVQNPFATVFMPGKGIKYYIKTSGGWSEKPDKGRIYVTYPDGSSDMTSSFIFRSYPRVKPGSHIIVPKQPERVQHPERSAFWLAMGSTAGTLAIAVVSILSIINKTP